MRGTLFILSILLSTNFSFAEKSRERVRLWKMEKELNCPDMPKMNEENEISESKSRCDEHFIVKNEFGPSKCATKVDLPKEKKTLDKECKEWLGERKQELLTKYLTGTCNSSCTTCEGNPVLKECNTKGEVHYTIKESPKSKD